MSSMCTAVGRVWCMLRREWMPRMSLLSFPRRRSSPFVPIRGWCPRRQTLNHARVGCISQSRGFVVSSRFSRRMPILYTLTFGPSDAAQWGVAHSGVVIRREGQVNQAEEVLQHFGIPVYARLPVLVNSSLQASLSIGYCLWVRWHAVVLPGLSVYTVYFCRMSVLPTLCEKAEVFQDEVLCSASDPRPYLGIDRVHDFGLGLLDSRVQTLSLAVTGCVGRQVTDCTVGVHLDDRLGLLPARLSGVLSRIHLSGWSMTGGIGGMVRGKLE